VSSTLTYVYCLVRAARRPSLRGVPHGIPAGDAVRLLDVPQLASARGRAAAMRHWLVVSTVPEPMYGADPLKNGLQELEWVGPRAVAHEAVIEHFLNADAVLPMQLFALFNSDDRAIEHVVSNRHRIGRILMRIDRQVEWGLRLMWDPTALERPDRGLTKRGDSARPQRVVSGADYLATKRNQRDRARTLLQRARADARRTYRAIAGNASEARRRTDVERAAPGSRLLLEAAFLVPARSTRSFQAAVRRHTGALEQSGIAVSLTGPWPPYNFI
jgi:gas vesicle protein GvpL/GvpF